MLTNSISFREFQVAMESVGAKSLPNRKGSRYNIPVPCFSLNGTEFLHSGSYYIVQRGHIVPEYIMNNAMAELGEKYPGGDNFWYGEIHSIKGILTLSTILEGNYSKKLIDELTNKAFKKLLDYPSIKSNVEFPFTGPYSPKMQKLHKLLAEYHSIVNPFGDSTLKTKEPINYLDRVQVHLSAKDETYSRLALATASTETYFSKTSTGWSYQSYVPAQKKRKSGLIHFFHYYDDSTGDEVVYLDYYLQKKRKSLYDRQPGEIDLRISLKTGLAWRTYKEDEATPATDEQINLMITHLKMSIKSLRKNILRNMIETK